MAEDHDHLVTPWLALLAAVAAGIGAWAVLPPLGWWPVAFAVPALLAVAVHDRHWHPAVLGGVTGIVGTALMVHWVQFRAGVVAWLLLALVGAAWYALLGWLLQHLLVRRATTLLAPLVWVGIDAWRNAWPLGGFGWGTLGISQVGNEWFVPLGRVLGEKGLTLVVVSVSLFAFVAIRDGLRAHRERTDGADPSRRAEGRPRRGPGEVVTDHTWFGTAGVVVVLLATALVTVGPPPEVDRAEVLAVQPNDQEHYDVSYAEITRVLANQAVAETRRAIEADGLPDLVVWPEGSIGRDPARDPVLAAAVAEAGRLTRGRLLLGTDLEDPDSTNYRRVSVRVRADGTLGQAYVKRHLVPFGEYVPFRSLVDWYPPLRQVPRDAIAGTSAEALQIDDLRLAVAICFETMFPDVVSSNVLDGDRPAQLVISSTSDASFGRTGQPAQHVDQARMRAIETGRWVVHAAVSGITVVVDPDGNAFGHTELFTVDSLRSEVGLVDGLTPFLRIGDVLDPVTRVLVVLAALFVVASRRRTSA